MATLDLQKGQTIGKWKLEQPLGEGGQAAVWSVKHSKEQHCQPGAVKICKDLSPKAILRFQQEIRLLKAHQHHGIVKVRDEGEHQERPFFVMERATVTFEKAIKGDTEGTRLLQESPALMLDLFRSACTAVAFLHSNGVLHRDIKPSNILLFLSPREPMRAAISDLGIGSDEDEQGALTATHEAIGTPSYRAPEATYGHHTKASDVYSLGKTLEHVLSRKVPPTPGPGRCSRDTRMSDALFDELDEVLQRACDMDPGGRYRDAGEFVSALPIFVLTTTSSQVTTSSQRDSLSKDEQMVLKEVIGYCPTDSDAVHVWQLQQHTKSRPDHTFSLAFRRLKTLGLIANVDALGEHEGLYPSVRPTERGIQWAQAQRQQELEDEIPF